MGNVAATIVRTWSDGPVKMVIADLSMSSSYATGGDTVPLSALGLSSLEALDLTSNTSGAALFHPLIVIHGANNRTAPKIMARDVAAGTEIANATNLSTMTGIRCIARGEGPF
jgi:hypothetical protein